MCKWNLAYHQYKHTNAPNAVQLTTASVLSLIVVTQTDSHGYIRWVHACTHTHTHTTHTHTRHTRALHVTFLPWCCPTMCGLYPRADGLGNICIGAKGWEGGTGAHLSGGGTESGKKRHAHQWAHQWGNMHTMKRGILLLIRCMHKCQNSCRGAGVAICTEDSWIDRLFHYWLSSLRSSCSQFTNTKEKYARTPVDQWEAGVAYTANT